MKFKVGDSVRFTGDIGSARCGDIGAILEPTPFSWDWRVSTTRNDMGFVAVFESEIEPEDDHPDMVNIENDTINHPSHYTAYKGIEVIQLTEQLNFNKGNVIKYVARAGLKDKDTELEDLKKAAWYLQREIERISNA